MIKHFTLSLYSTHPEKKHTLTTSICGESFSSFHTPPHCFCQTQTQTNRLKRTRVSEANVGQPCTWFNRPFVSRSPSVVPDVILNSLCPIILRLYNRVSDLPPVCCIKYTHGPIRCQILGCFQATYIRLQLLWGRLGFMFSMMFLPFE